MTAPQLKPTWQPRTRTDISVIEDRMRFYSDGKLNIAIFENGTCVFLKSIEDYEKKCNDAFDGITKVTPDFTVRDMKDGNFLIMFRDPLYALVTRQEFYDYRSLIETNFEDAKLPAEQFVSGAKGENSDHCLVGLYARAKMFMDVESRRLSKLVTA